MIGYCPSDVTGVSANDEVNFYPLFLEENKQLLLYSSIATEICLRSSLTTSVCVCDSYCIRQTSRQNHKAKVVHTSFLDCMLVS